MARMDVSAIGAYIKEQREQAKISLRQLAQSAGISNPYLSQIERGLRRPSADILQQIAKGLRISAEALYVQAGFLEDRPPGSVVREAVLTDQQLTERQKQMLIEIYESFRKETVMSRAAESIEDESDFGTDEAALIWPEDVGPEALRKPRRLSIAGQPVRDAAAGEAESDDDEQDDDEQDDVEQDDADSEPGARHQHTSQQGGTIHPFPRPPENR